MALAPGGSVLDIGCGFGDPVTPVLIKQGLDISAIDASPTLVAEFRRRFPDIRVACEAVEESSYFDRKFDGILAIGLVFLLDTNVQRSLLARLAKALIADGRLLFSAPQEACEWKDVLTGQRSISLGSEAYSEILKSAGLRLMPAYKDEGGNYYYNARKG